MHTWLDRMHLVYLTNLHSCFKIILAFNYVNQITLKSILAFNYVYQVTLSFIYVFNVIDQIGKSCISRGSKGNLGFHPHIPLEQPSKDVYNVISLTVYFKHQHKW